MDRAYLGRLRNTDYQSVRPAELHSAELNDPRIDYPRDAQALKSAFRRLVPAMLLVGGILICCPTLSFGQSKTVRLNENTFAYAEELIAQGRSEEHTSELQSRFDLVCRLLLEKKKKKKSHSKNLIKQVTDIWTLTSSAYPSSDGKKIVQC